MSEKARYVFHNKGKPFSFSLGETANGIWIELSDGNLRVRNENIISVEVIEKEIITHQFFHRKKIQTSILARYSLVQGETVFSREIDILENEIDRAKVACTVTTKALSLQKAQTAARKREYEKQLAKARSTDLIDAIGLDGAKTKIWRKETYFRDVVLYSEGGVVYHTHADCFESWKPMYQRKFVGWKLITIADARKMSLRECTLCAKYYDFLEDETNPDDELQESLDSKETKFEDNE